MQEKDPEQRPPEPRGSNSPASPPDGSPTAGPAPQQSPKFVSRLKGYSFGHGSADASAPRKSSESASAGNSHNSGTPETPLGTSQGSSTPQGDREAHVLASIWHDLSRFTTRMVSRASHQLRSAAPPLPAAAPDDAAGSDAGRGGSLTSYVTSLLPSGLFPSTFSPLASHADIVLQGARYNAPSAPRFMTHWASLPWITYREGIPPLRPSTFTSDVGWGCMIRAGQMMLASALLSARFGREFRLADLRPEQEPEYVSTMFQFLDTVDAAFSIHRIALVGQQLVKSIGDWFGPSTIAQALCQLVHEYPQSPLTVHVATDAIVYSATVEELLRVAAPRPCLVLIPLRLGVDALNPVYVDGLKTCLESGDCIGMAGGRPNSALFFVGYQDDRLLCLDPHISRPAVDLRPDLDYTVDDFSSYVCDTPRALPVARIDPSLVIGFLIRDSQALQQFVSRWSRMATLTSTPLFSVGDEPPSYYVAWDSVHGRLSQPADAPAAGDAGPAAADAPFIGAVAAAAAAGRATPELSSDASSRGAAKRSGGSRRTAPRSGASSSLRQKTRKTLQSLSGATSKAKRSTLKEGPAEVGDGDDEDDEDDEDDVSVDDGVLSAHEDEEL